MKVLTWDPMNDRYKEVVTGRVLTADTEPDLDDGDIWIDSSQDPPVLSVQIDGNLYQLETGGGEDHFIIVSPGHEYDTGSALYTVVGDLDVTTSPSLYSAIMSESPEAFWLNNDSTTAVLDHSGNSRNAAWSSTAVTRRVAGGALGDWFARIGASYRMTVADNNAWTPSASGLTVFFIAKRDQFTADPQTLFSKGVASTSLEWEIETETGGALRVRLVTPTGTVIRQVTYAANTIETDWNVFCVVFSGNTEAATIDVYKDDGTTPLTPDTNTTATSATVTNGSGVLNVSNRSTSTPFRGSMAYIAIWNYGMDNSPNIENLMDAAANDGWI